MQRLSEGEHRTDVAPEFNIYGSEIARNRDVDRVPSCTIQVRRVWME